MSSSKLCSITAVNTAERTGEISYGSYRQPVSLYTKDYRRIYTRYTNFLYTTTVVD